MGWLVAGVLIVILIMRIKPREPQSGGRDSRGKGESARLKEMGQAMGLVLIKHSIESIQELSHKGVLQPLDQVMAGKPGGGELLILHMYLVTAYDHENPHKAPFFDGMVDSIGNWLRQFEDIEGSQEIESEFFKKFTERCTEYSIIYTNTNKRLERDYLKALGESLRRKVRLFDGVKAAGQQLDESEGGGYHVIPWEPNEIREIDDHILQTMVWIKSTWDDLLASL